MNRTIIDLMRAAVKLHCKAKWLMMESMVSKTLVAWVIYGMTSYPVVQGLFHETINGCQVIQAVTFWSAIVWDHLTFKKGSLNHPKKGHKELPGLQTFPTYHYWNIPHTPKPQTNNFMEEFLSFAGERGCWVFPPGVLLRIVWKLMLCGLNKRGSLY